MSRPLLVLSVVLSMFFTPLAGSASQENTEAAEVNIEIVMDVSGSMAGATDTQEMRMTAAQRVLNEVIAAIPEADNINVGLRLYGHRGNNTESGKAESCASSELVVPIDGLNREGLIQQVNALQPTGWTPLGTSIDLARQDLQSIATPGSSNAIIVLTDGIETCGGNPVAAAAAAFDSEPSIRTFVIGFALTAEDQASLAEVARAGGGDPISANNAGQLISALFTVLEELEVVEEGGNGESRESPIGLGRIGRVGDYDLNVVSVTADANQLVASENQFNEPPAPGNQFFMARVAVTYVGESTGQPAVDLDLQAVGDLNKGYAWYTDTCGVIPDDPFMTTTDLFPGGSAEFNVCWQINSEDADSLVMYATSTWDLNSNQVWFSLGNTVISPTASESEDPIATPEPGGAGLKEVVHEETPASTEVPLETDSTGDGNARDLPVAFGAVGRVGDYEVSVVSVEPMANEIVAAENQFNEPPASGKQFFMVRVSVTYIGSTSGMPASDLDFQTVGDLNKGYAWYTDTCGVIPDDPFMTATDLFPGGSVQFNICWQIESADADSLVMYVSSLWDFNSDPIWFSLQP